MVFSIVRLKWRISAFEYIFNALFFISKFFKAMIPTQYLQSICFVSGILKHWNFSFKYSIGSIQFTICWLSKTSESTIFQLNSPKWFNIPTFMDCSFLYSLNYLTICIFNLILCALEVCFQHYFWDLTVTGWSQLSSIVLKCWFCWFSNSVLSSSFRIWDVFNCIYLPLLDISTDNILMDMILSNVLHTRFKVSRIFEMCDILISSPDCFIATLSCFLTSTKLVYLCNSWP